MGKNNFDNKRKYERIEMSIKVNCIDFIASEKIAANSRNLSEGGICIATDKPLSIGRHINLVFYLPGKENFKIIAEVKWSKKIEDKLYESGLEFTDISKRNKDRIVDYISQKESNKKDRRDSKRIILGIVVNFISAEAKIKNISNTGMCITSNELLPESMTSEVMFFLPNNRYVKADGTILWREKVSEDTYDYGIEFTKIDKESLSHIKKFMLESDII